MKITLDKEIDALYIKLDNKHIEKTDSFSMDNIDFGQININFDDKNKIIGIEILQASTLLDKKLLLDHIR